MSNIVEKKPHPYINRSGNQLPLEIASYHGANASVTGKKMKAIAPPIKPSWSMTIRRQIKKPQIIAPKKIIPAGILKMSPINDLNTPMLTPIGSAIKNALSRSAQIENCRRGHWPSHKCVEIVSS